MSVHTTKRKGDQIWILEDWSYFVLLCWLQPNVAMAEKKRVYL